MLEDFAIEKTREGIELNRENVENLKFSFIEGLCAANPENPGQPRDSAWYITNVLNPLLEQGKLSTKGVYDDRKFRYDGATIKADTLEVALGANHYHAFKADFNKSGEELMKLHELGIKHFNDKYAFLSCRAPGVAALIITSDGSTFLGERINEDDKGLLNAVAGHMIYRENIADVKLKDSLFRQIKQEFGIDDKLIKEVAFVGSYSNPLRGDFDFAHIVKVDKPDNYFSSGEWMKYVSEREHKPLVRLATFAEIKELLSEGRLPGYDKKYSLMYSTRGALESLRKGEIRD